MPDLSTVAERATTAPVELVNERDEVREETEKGHAAHTKSAEATGLPDA